MRHRIKLKNFNRIPKHRKALFRNLIQELIVHERIITTYAKAKYLMPIAQKVINKGKMGYPYCNKSLGKMFYDQTVVNKVVNELAPRFRDNDGNYVRIRKQGKRRVDKAQMATIEYLGNYLEVYEKDDMKKRKNESGTMEFWDWEMKILEQEKQYIEEQLELLRYQISDEESQEEEIVIDYEQQENIPDSSIATKAPKSLSSKNKLKLKSQIKYFEHRLKVVEKDIEEHEYDRDTEKYQKIDEHYTFDN